MSGMVRKCGPVRCDLDHDATWPPHYRQQGVDASAPALDVRAVDARQHDARFTRTFDEPARCLSPLPEPVA